MLGLSSRLIASTLLLAIPALPLSAHHSFAMFDPAKPMSFEATVKTLQWTAPHAILWVQAAQVGKYAPGLWSLELPTSPGNLSKMGWSRASLKAGDKVIVDINPIRDGRRAGQFKKVTIVATGKTLTVGAIPGAQPPK
ncbi:DUF6152 family protein [Sphingobium bisphenolivorans]|uniref:DUF6152 family protein n=1 Tax=Sphingobium bisphenolivorans TaxID=1335760 RepID=UPI0003A135B7|nr:DUF6152 family protein [Sphingobium bisphenolivorans]